MGKTKIKPITFFANYIYYYPVLTMCASLVGDKLVRLLAQFSLILFMIADLCKTSQNKEKRNRHLFFFCFVAVFIIYVAALQGYYQLINSDFYALLLLLFIFDYFSDRKNLYKLRSIATNPKRYKMLLLSYMAILFLSLIAAHGFRVYESGPPVLHGPYMYPHVLAYSLIGMYCATGIIGQGKRIKYSLLIKAIITILVILTGVRTAALAIALIIMADYFSLKKFSIKMSIAMILIAGVVILALYTDFLTNNPIMQRTILAATRGTGASNGRGKFNAYLLEPFAALSPRDKFFGIGLEQIRKLMKLRRNVYIHAHNDLLNVLLGYGIFGFSVFIALLFGFCKRVKRWWLLMASILVLIFFNGLYMYHTFTPFMVIMPMFFTEIHRKPLKRKKRLLAAAPLTANSEDIINKNECK